MLYHRTAEFIPFLRTLDKATPRERDLHLIVDKYAAHRPPRSSAGWPPIPASTSTSPRPRRPGSTPSRASSPSSPSAAPPQARHLPLRPRPQPRHSRIHQGSQCRSQALRLDRTRRHHHRQGQPRETSASGSSLIEDSLARWIVRASVHEDHTPRCRHRQGEPRETSEQAPCPARLVPSVRSQGCSTPPRSQGRTQGHR